MAGKSNKTAANDTIAASDSMDQVRELLFGEQQRRFDAAIETIQQHIQALEKQSAKSLDDQVSRLENALSETQSSLESRIADTQSQLEAQSQETDQRLAQQIDDTQTQLEHRLKEAQSELQSQCDVLASEKADRKHIATLLKQMADAIES